MHRAAPVATLPGQLLIFAAWSMQGSVEMVVDVVFDVYGGVKKNSEARRL